MQGLSVGDFASHLLTVKNYNNHANTNALVFYGDPLYSPFKNTKGENPMFETDKLFNITACESTVGGIGYTAASTSSIDSDYMNGFLITRAVLTQIATIGRAVITIATTANLPNLPANAIRDILLKYLHVIVDGEKWPPSTYNPVDQTITFIQPAGLPAYTPPIVGTDFSFTLTEDSRCFWVDIQATASGLSHGFQTKLKAPILNEVYGWSEPFNPNGIAGLDGFLGINNILLNRTVGLIEEDALSPNGYENGQQPYYGFAMGGQIARSFNQDWNDVKFFGYTDNNQTEAFFDNFIANQTLLVFLFVTKAEMDDYNRIYHGITSGGGGGGGSDLGPSGGINRGIK